MIRTITDKYVNGELEERITIENDGYESSIKCGDMSRTRRFHTFEEMMTFSGFDSPDSEKPEADSESQNYQRYLKEHSPQIDNSLTFVMPIDAEIRSNTFSPQIITKKSGLPWEQKNEIHSMGTET